jgi:hypothetical protein
MLSTRARRRRYLAVEEFTFEFGVLLSDEIFCNRNSLLGIAPIWRSDFSHSKGWDYEVSRTVGHDLSSWKASIPFGWVNRAASSSVSESAAVSNPPCRLISVPVEA